MRGVRLGLWDCAWRGVFEDVWRLEISDRCDMNLQDGVNKYDAGTEDVVLNLSGAGVMSNIRP